MGDPRLRAPLRLGTVPFLNAKPLTYALEARRDAVVLREAPPSELAPLLASGALDAALLSSFVLFHIPGVRYVPGVGISSDGPVGSIRLFCRKPPEALARVGLDAWSLAASNMARVLLKRRWGARPGFFPIDPLRPPREDPGFDAFLHIGDNALREAGAGFEVIDLGEEWTRATGLPFVYALWVFRAGAGDAEACRLLQRAKTEGVRRMEEILEDALPAYPHLDALALRTYLTMQIRYDVGRREEAGLRRFYEYLVEDGLAPPGWEADRLEG